MQEAGDEEAGVVGSLVDSSASSNVTQSRGAPAHSSATLHGAANMQGTAPLEPLLQIKQLRALSKGSDTRAWIFLRARAD